MVTTFPDAAKRWTISNQGGSNPVWRRDGRELFFLDEQDTLMSVAILPGTDLKLDVPKVLFPSNGVATDGAVFAVGRDGRLLIARSASQAAGTPLRVVLNGARLALADQ